MMGVVNDTGYDPTGPALSGRAIATPLNIQAGVVAAYRLVSASAVISPVGSFNTAAGLIHGTLYLMDGLFNTAIPVNGAIGLIPSLTEITSSPHYANCQAINTNNLEVTWQPNDTRMLEMKGVNTNYQTNENAFNEPVILLYVTGGISAGTPLNYNLTITLNFEVNPGRGSVLTGMETISDHNEIPTVIWRERLIHGTVTRIYNNAAQHKHMLGMAAANYEARAAKLIKSGKSVSQDLIDDSLRGNSKLPRGSYQDWAGYQAYKRLQQSGY